MAEIGKDGWLVNDSAWKEDEAHKEEMGKEPGRVPLKTVMVYCVDHKSMQREPIGILTERRRLERDNNNAIGMLRLARKEFARTEEEAKRIIIGEYV
jgi:hypothetical protein